MATNAAFGQCCQCEAGRLHLTTGQSFLAAVAVGREFAELELHTRRTTALGSQSARVCWSQRSWVTRARFVRAKSKCIHVDAYFLDWGPPGPVTAMVVRGPQNVGIVDVAMACDPLKSYTLPENNP